MISRWHIIKAQNVLQQGEKIVLLFQVSHTRKKVIYFPHKCFCIIFILLLLPAFIFLNQYNHVHEVLCISCVSYCFASSIHSLISFHFHMMCTKWNDKIVHLYLFHLLFLLVSAIPNLFHLCLPQNVSCGLTILGMSWGARS